MLTPLQYLQQYQNISVDLEYDDPSTRTCRVISVKVKLNSYFQINWAPGTSQLNRFNAVTAGSSKDKWFKQNQEAIRTAAMGKGSPDEYGLALQWAVHEGHIKNPSQSNIQAYFDSNMGIDCSGFVTNYLIANGKLKDSDIVRQNTGANSYLNATQAVNDPLQVRQGDLLVMVNKGQILHGAGHIAVVQSYVPQSMAAGNMEVIESTAAPAAHPKLTTSMYTVEKISSGKFHSVACMVLVVKRFGISNSHFCVIRK